MELDPDYQPFEWLSEIDLQDYKDWLFGRLRPDDETVIIEPVSKAEQAALDEILTF